MLYSALGCRQESCEAKIRRGFYLFGKTENQQKNGPSENVIDPYGRIKETRPGRHQ
jgi:hypothetical protein